MLLKDDRAAVKSQTTRRTGVLVTLVALLVVGVIVSATVGQLQIGARGVIGTLLHGMGVTTDWRPDEISEQTLWHIRFPRVVMSLLVGCALAVAGTVMQAIFGNPLAEPGVVGVSSGAALGASIAIVTGVTAFGGWGVAIAAFIGGFIATVLVYSMARSNGRTEVVTLLLTGIAINAVAGAGLGLVLFSGDRSSREQIVFWQLGSMNGSRWVEVVIVLAIVVPFAALAIALSRRYDLLALGERTALHLGVRVERLRLVSIVIVVLLTAVSVAFTGIIAFGGLVVPHLMRMLLGPSHRMLLIASVIGGGVLLVWADLIARTAVSGADLPIGMLTALVGGPFFFYLIRRARSRSGGWA